MKLRKWVQYVIIFIMMIALFVLGGECDDTLVFIASKVIALAIMISGAIVLEKYGTIIK